MRFGRKDGLKRPFAGMARLEGQSHHVTRTYFWAQMVDFCVAKASYKSKPSTPVLPAATMPTAHVEIAPDIAPPGSTAPDAPAAVATTTASSVPTADLTEKIAALFADAAPPEKQRAQQAQQFGVFIQQPTSQMLRNPDLVDKYYSAKCLERGQPEFLPPDLKNLPTRV